MTPVLREFFAVCPRGFEDVTAAELTALGAQSIEPSTSGVYFSGGKEVLYRANLWLRSASRVLVPLREFAAKHPMMLYDQIKRMKWEDMLDVTGTFVIECSIFNSDMSHSHYAELRAKDAVCDRFRELNGGRRPSVDKVAPDLRINLFINNNRCILSLDSSGESLHRRGYRVDGAMAPLKENLAAALLLRAGYDGSTPLFDPMCGSGTFLIEAAMIATHTAPGLMRRRFGFTSWRDFDGGIWSKILAEARDKVLTQAPSTVVGTEIDHSAARAAQENVENAGMRGVVRIVPRDFRTLETQDQILGKTANCGTLVTNPPYGERIEADLSQLYKDLGDLMKKKFPGWGAYVLTGNMEAAKSVGLKPSRRYEVTNGGIDARFLKYELYSGSKKTS